MLGDDSAPQRSSEVSRFHVAEACQLGVVFSSAQVWGNLNILLLVDHEKLNKNNAVG